MKEFSVPQRQPKVKNLIPPTNSQTRTQKRSSSVLSTLKIGPFKLKGFKKQNNN